MEAVLVVFAFFFFVIVALSSVFLTLIQPLWAIIDIAVSEKISQGAKIFLLICILAGIPICIISVFGIISSVVKGSFEAYKSEIIVFSITRIFSSGLFLLI